MHSGGQEQHLQQRSRPPTKDRKMKTTSTSTICHCLEPTQYSIHLIGRNGVRGETKIWFRHPARLVFVWEETQKLSKILIDIEREDKAQLRRKRRRQNDGTDDAPEAKRLTKERSFSQRSFETHGEPMEVDFSTSVEAMEVDFSTPAEPMDVD